MSSIPSPSFVINENILGFWFRGSSSSNKFKNLTSQNEKQHSNSSTAAATPQQECQIKDHDDTTERNRTIPATKFLSLRHSKKFLMD